MIEYPVRKSTLKNGMRVITAESRDNRVVSIQFCVGVGSVHESNDHAGAAHFIEHMLFKGTEVRGVGAIAEAIESSGGDINAYTSFDLTVYYVTLASRFIDTGLEVLADAVLNSKFDSEEVEREREVILEEIKRSEDNPSSVIDKMLFGTSYKVHNYKRPIIGFDHTVKRLSREDLLGFKNRWYVGQNCFLVASGDFDSESFVRKAEKLFAGLSAGDGSEFKLAQEPNQDMMRVKFDARPIATTHLSMAFPIPPFAHPDTAVLDILGIILGQGESSRLYSELKLNRNIVHSVAAGGYSPKDPGLFIVGAELDADKVEESVRAALEIVNRVKREPVSADEIEKARTIVESQMIHEIETVQGLASKLVGYEHSAGDIAYEEKYLKQLVTTTANDIQRVADQYFSFNRLNVVALFPKEHQYTVDKSVIGQIARSFDTPQVVKTEKATPPKAKEATLVRKALPSGTAVIIKEIRRVELFSMCLVFKGGCRYETENNNGVSNFMTTMLTKGTKSYNAQELAEFFESRGASVRPFSGKNTFGLKVEGLSRYFDELLDATFEMLSFPSFDYDELQKERQSILDELRSQEDSLSTLAFLMFNRLLYGNHPYALNVLGDRRTITNLSRGEIVSFYERYAQASNLTISVVGNVDSERVMNRIEEQIRSIRSNKVMPPILPPIKPVDTVRRQFVHKEKEQAHLVLGYLGTTFDSPDRYALEVLNSVFSSMSGRLFTELRDKQSLCYSVSSICQEGIDRGHVAFYIATSRTKIEDAIGGILNEIKRAIAEPPGEEELNRAKRYIVGNHEISLQRNEAQAALYAFNDKYGRSIEEVHRFPENIMSVTQEDIWRVAKEYLNPEAYVLSIVRPNE